MRTTINVILGVLLFACGMFEFAHTINVANIPLSDAAVIYSSVAVALIGLKMMSGKSQKE